jgi:lysophospholipase L1-like esterase
MSKMRIILVVLSFIFCGNIYAQINLENLDFINLDKNVLVYNKDSSLIIPFFRKLDSITKNNDGNINIIHFGGSHVQAGILPNRIRINLLNVFNENIGSRGIIFPYSAARKCNNPLDYSVTKHGDFNLIRNVYDSLPKPLGVTGIAIYTDEKFSHIKITLQDTVKYRTNKIKLFAFSENSEINPTIIIDNTEYSYWEKDTQRRTYTFCVDDFYDSFIVNIPNEENGTFTLTGILLENDEPGITYHSIGVNGASVASFLKCEYFSLDLESINPDLVIFGLGINDASETEFDENVFVENYLLLIDKIRKVNPECAFLFITNNDSYFRISKNDYKVNTRGIIVRELFFRLAEKTKGAVWDQFEVMGGLKSMVKWERAKLAKTDKVHFTNIGYELIGDLFFNAFIKAYLGEVQKDYDTK